VTPLFAIDLVEYSDDISEDVDKMDTTLMAVSKDFCFDIEQGALYLCRPLAINPTNATLREVCKPIKNLSDYDAPKFSTIYSYQFSYPRLWVLLTPQIPVLLSKIMGSVDSSKQRRSLSFLHGLWLETME